MEVKSQNISNLLSLQEAANYLTVSTSWLYHNKSKIRHINFSRNVKFRISDLDDFIEKNSERVGLDDEEKEKKNV